MAEKNNKNKQILEEIRYAEIFAIADSKTSDAKIP